MNRRLSAVLELHGVDHPARDHQVVAVLEVDVAQEGAQGAAALVDEDHLIAVGVLVEVVHALRLRRGEHDGAVAVHQHGLARGQVVLLGLGLEAMQPQRAHVLLDRDLRADVLRLAQLLHHRGAVHVVAQGAHAIEADGAEELLVEEAVLAVLEDGVPLVGDLAQGMVDRHWSRL
jgi:hypothetical protein